MDCGIKKLRTIRALESMRDSRLAQPDLALAMFPSADHRLPRVRVVERDIDFNAFYDLGGVRVNCYATTEREAVRLASNKLLEQLKTNFRPQNTQKGAEAQAISK